AVLANASSATAVLAGAGLWGLHMGLTQGLLAALVAGAAPADLRGTAFGVFNLVCGIALLAASALAGWLWSGIGPAATFYAGAGFTASGWAGYLLYGRRAEALRGTWRAGAANGCKLGRGAATYSACRTPSSLSLVCAASSITATRCRCG